MLRIRQEWSSFCTAGMIITADTATCVPSVLVIVDSNCIQLHAHALQLGQFEAEMHSTLSCGGEAHLPQVGAGATVTSGLYQGCLRDGWRGL